MPAKPAVFSPEGAPVGVEVRFVTFFAERPLMATTPRLQLVHTNAAQREGNITSAWNWAHAAPHRNTCPHYQIDLDGRARKMLPSNRVGIANATVDAYQEGRGDVREWSLAYETADTGTLADPSISAFTAPQAETLAQVLAYESITNGIPLSAPSTWWGAGTAAHTDPFGYPYWTTVSGKTCPGAKKKAQLRDLVIPRARAIVAEWTAPPPTPLPPPDEQDDDMRWCVNRNGGYWLYNGVSKAPVKYPDAAPSPAGDLRLLALLLDLKAQGWRMGPDVDGVPQPMVLSDWWLATFDAAPSG